MWLVVVANNVLRVLLDLDRKVAHLANVIQLAPWIISATVPLDNVVADPILTAEHATNVNLDIGNLSFI